MSWLTVWEPLPDITAYELALDIKHISVNVVCEHDIIKLGPGPLRHRTTTIGNKVIRMDEVAKIWLKHLTIDCSNEFTNITAKTYQEFDDQTWTEEFEIEQAVKKTLDEEFLRRSV